MYLGRPSSSTSCPSPNLLILAIDVSLFHPVSYIVRLLRIDRYFWQPYLLLSMPANAGEEMDKGKHAIIPDEAQVKRRLIPGIGGVGSPDWNVRSLHVVPTDLPISQLRCTKAWNLLTDSQKHFVHHFGQASWSGSRIYLHQLSKESPDIMRILLLLFSSTDLVDLETRSKGAGVTKKEWKFLLAYASCFLTNLGNYLAFGDLKVVPGISVQKLNAVVNACPLEGERKHRLVSLWEKTCSRIYSLLPGERNLGIPPGGCSAYYSEDITVEEINLVSEWMRQEHIEPWNTRIWRKNSSGNYGSLPEYDVRIASALEYPTHTDVFAGKCVIHVVYGDYKEDLIEVVRHLKDTLPYVDNDTQRQMVNFFILYMETGLVEFHKKSQEIWLKQKDPTFEFNLGFVETYRDPNGSRAEFEGFVAIVNKVATEQFATLIEKADLLLPFLPWPKDYEADKFMCPSFSCIEVFLYANGTVPAGMNLPNYEDVREAFGSRNFCLTNVVESHDLNLKTTFLKDEDVKLSNEIKGDVFIVQLAFHELLGHGSGKLFTRGQGGEYNFSRGTVMHPFTDEAVMTCYGPGETWNSIFGQISSALEECRAECVGIYLSTYPQALEVFGHVGQHADDIMYMNWLLMARGGLLAIEFVSLDSGDWRQAHMQVLASFMSSEVEILKQTSIASGRELGRAVCYVNGRGLLIFGPARFAILRTLLVASAKEAAQNIPDGIENGHDFLEILSRGQDDLIVHLNRDKIRSVGLPAIRDLLVKLQVYRSTADVNKGRQLLAELTTVPTDMLRYRRALSANKRPRPMFVQSSTRSGDVDGDSRIEIEEFDPTPEGLIQSYVAHFEDWIPEC